MKRVAWILGFVLFVLLAAHFELGLFPGLWRSHIPPADPGLSGLVSVDLTVRADATGRIDASYRKRYPLGRPFEDLVSLPGRSQWFDYPQVQVETTGKVTAQVDHGVVRIKGDGPGTVHLRIVDLDGSYLGDPHSWWFSAAFPMPGLGPQVISAFIVVPSGARPVGHENGIELSGLRQQGMVAAQREGNIWLVRTGRVEEGTTAMLKLSYRNPWVLPAWLVLLSLGLVLVAVALAYAAYRRTRSVRQTEGS